MNSNGIGKWWFTRAGSGLGGCLFFPVKHGRFPLMLSRSGSWRGEGGLWIRRAGSGRKRQGEENEGGKGMGTGGKEGGWAKEGGRGCVSGSVYGLTSENNGLKRSRWLTRPACVYIHTLECRCRLYTNNRRINIYSRWAAISIGALPRNSWLPQDRSLSHCLV